MKLRHFTSLHTDFDTEACRHRLTESIDPERRTLFSLSGYKGSKPIIGTIKGHEFVLHKRRYYRNDFAPQFYGSIQRNERGTVIEGYFDMDRWAKWFMRIWLGLVILVGSSFFLSALWDFVRGANHPHDGFWVGLLVLPTMVLFGLLLPKFGLWLGRNEEQYILEFLQTTLIASPSQITHHSPA
jgi:hypothetical protein